MKKFTEVEIVGVGSIMVQGTQHTQLLQDLMKNQNDIIDWIESHNHIVKRVDEVSLGEDARAEFLRPKVGTAYAVNEDGFLLFSRRSTTMRISKNEILDVLDACFSHIKRHGLKDNYDREVDAKEYLRIMTEQLSN